MLLGYERLCLNTSTGEYTDHFSINNFGNQENILNFSFSCIELWRYYVWTTRYKNAVSLR